MPVFMTTPSSRINTQFATHLVYFEPAGEKGSEIAQEFIHTVYIRIICK
jgi:hypothetical protein